MEIIDTHTHLNFRSREEMEELVFRGYDSAITCAFSPIRPRCSDSMLDLYDLILERYAGNREGLKVYAALGIHPRSIPRKSYRKVLSELPGYLEDKRVVAMGEVGLERGGRSEIYALGKQLEIARDSGAKVILHTPRKYKDSVFDKELDVIERVGLDPKQVMVDHSDEYTLGRALEKGFYAGLTISDGKLTADKAKSLLTVYSNYAKRIMLNSDLGYSSRDIYSLADAVDRLEEELGDSIMEMVAYKNAKRFFRI